MRQLYFPFPLPELSKLLLASRSHQTRLRMFSILGVDSARQFGPDKLETPPKKEKVLEQRGKEFSLLDRFNYTESRLRLVIHWGVKLTLDYGWSFPQGLKTTDRLLAAMDPHMAFVFLRVCIGEATEKFLINQPENATRGRPDIIWKLSACLHQRLLTFLFDCPPPPPRNKATLTQRKQIEMQK